MRLRVGCPSFGTDSGRSGIGSYMQELINRFDDEKLCDEFSFELIGPEKDRDAYLSSTRHISWYQVEGADRSPIHNYIWNQFSLPKICRERGYDLLFLPAANRRLTGRAPCPSVGTVHDMAQLHIPEKYDLIHSVFNRRLLPRLVRTLDHVITVSQFSKDDIVRFSRVPENRVTVTHLAADADRFFPVEDRQASGERVAGKYGFTTPYLLYISRLEHPGKNHVALIQAFDQFRTETGLKYALVLPGPDRERAAEIHAAADQAVHKADIIFPGFIDADDVADFYRGADLFVLPSRFEGFGLPTIEAMACGTPVITSTCASLPEVGGPHTPKFDPDDIEGLARMMRKVLGDRDEWDTLSRQGLEWAAEFSWEKTVAMTLKIFRETADKR